MYTSIRAIFNHGLSEYVCCGQQSFFPTVNKRIRRSITAAARWATFSVLTTYVIYSIYCLFRTGYMRAVLAILLLKGYSWFGFYVVLAPIATTRACSGHRWWCIYGIKHCWHLFHFILRQKCLKHSTLWYGWCTKSSQAIPAVANAHNKQREM